MEYPLTLSFKIATIAPQFLVTDAAGKTVFFVKQKAFKLKESVTVFADVEQTRPIATILADRVIDFTATYRFTDSQSREFGAVRRSGMKSMWKAHYEILKGDASLFTIQEENVWIKMADGFLMEIPLVNLLSGYLFHPAYRVLRSDGAMVLRAKKQPAFLEGKFTIERHGTLDEVEEALSLMSLLMVVLLERRRG
jgi:hypothetical protein